jgi:hypothetical protein
MTSQGNAQSHPFHVGSTSTDVLALPAIVDGLLAGGYRFATIHELIAD